MTIIEFFTKLDIIALTIYLAATFFSTEATKLIWGKKRKEKLPISPLYISWIFGAIFITIVRAIAPSYITVLVVFQFVFLTLALNSGVWLWKKIQKLRELKKKLGDNNE